MQYPGECETSIHLWIDHVSRERISTRQDKRSEVERLINDRQIQNNIYNDKLLKWDKLNVCIIYKQHY